MSVCFYLRLFVVVFMRPQFDYFTNDCARIVGLQSDRVQINTQFR